MEWKLPEEKPEEGSRVWIYIPFFPERWRFDTPEVISCIFYEGRFRGIGEENEQYVKAWFPWIEAYSLKAPRYIRPERSKREDSGHKYCYELVDPAAGDTFKEMIRGYVFFKQEADSWRSHGPLRSTAEKLVCKVFPEMRCSEHCGNTVSDK